MLGLEIRAFGNSGSAFGRVPISRRKETRVGNAQVPCIITHNTVHSTPNIPYLLPGSIWGAGGLINLPISCSLFV